MRQVVWLKVASVNSPHLLLWLEAPLQSWGHDSKFGRRDTMSFPTKSGVLGLVCSALGAGGEQRPLLDEFSELKQVAISFIGANKDREPLLSDFHMVGSGYNQKDPWERLLNPKKGDGSNSVGGGTKLTYRYYLQDAAFAVVIEVPNERSSLIAEALQNPAWDIYLGRKCCVPTDFIYRGLFHSIEDAIDEALKIGLQKERSENFRVVEGELDIADEVLTINDVPVQFGEIKRYRDRQVSLIYAG